MKIIKIVLLIVFCLKNSTGLFGSQAGVKKISSCGRIENQNDSHTLFQSRSVSHPELLHLTMKKKELLHSNNCIKHAPVDDIKVEPIKKTQTIAQLHKLQTHDVTCETTKKKQYLIADDQEMLMFEKNNFSACFSKDPHHNKQSLFIKNKKLLVISPVEDIKIVQQNKNIEKTPSCDGLQTFFKDQAIIQPDLVACHSPIRPRRYQAIRDQALRSYPSDPILETNAFQICDYVSYLSRRKDSGKYKKMHVPNQEHAQSRHKTSWYSSFLHPLRLKKMKSLTQLFSMKKKK